MTKRSVRFLIAGMAMVTLAGCASVQQPSPYRLTPDGAKEFTLRMDQGNFWPSNLVVNQGDRVRLVIYSSYQFAQFSFPQFNITRQIPHDAPDSVEFVAAPRGWFDFYGYVSYPAYGSIILVRGFGGRNGDPLTIQGRLYVQ